MINKTSFIIYIIYMIVSQISSYNIQKLCLPLDNLKTKKSFGVDSYKDIYKNKKPIDEMTFRHCYAVDFYPMSDFDKEPNTPTKVTLKVLKTNSKDDTKITQEIENLQAIKKLNINDSRLFAYKYFGCYYGKNKDEDKKENKYMIFIITEFLHGNIKNQKNFKLFLNQDQRIFHYERLFEQLLKIHKGGYIHMNIKPGNIMSTNIIRNNFSDFMLKFVDFKWMEKKGAEKFFIGTQCYMYPPLYNDKGVKVDEKVDIYSFFASIAVIEYGEQSIAILPSCYTSPNKYNNSPECLHKNIVNNVFKGYLSSLKNIDIYNDVKNNELFNKIVAKRNNCDSLICLVLKYFMWEECMEDINCKYDDETVFKEFRKIYDLSFDNGYKDDQNIYEEIPENDHFYHILEKEENIYEEIPENDPIYHVLEKEENIYEEIQENDPIYHVLEKKENIYEPIDNQKFKDENIYTKLRLRKSEDDNSYDTFEQIKLNRQKLNQNLISGNIYNILNDPKLSFENLNDQKLKVQNINQIGKGNFII